MKKKNIKKEMVGVQKLSNNIERKSSCLACWMVRHTKNEHKTNLKWTDVL